MSGIPSYGSLDGNNDVFPGPGDSSGIASGALPTDVTLWPSPIAYNSPSSSFDPASVSSSYTKTTLQTSTWTNLIPEQTTTYTINYPLTTLATIIPPVMTPVVKRPVRRQYQQ
jgi:hypothetical protein